MAKLFGNKTESVGVQFLDRTEKKWYVSKTENKITLCESIDDIINGKGESFEFTNKMISKRIYIKNEKNIEKNMFILISLNDGNFMLLKRWYELN